MDKSTHVISQVEEASPGARAGFKAGDILISINGHEIKDIFDYHYLSDDEKLDAVVLRKDSEIRLKVRKSPGEDLGISFKSGLMDDYKSCRNKCIFCFIDQMPPGMRDTLYFKDDDTRLSFLQGNYVTLTNVSDEELDRIIGYRLAPINVSVHATDPKLRCEMLNNRFAGDIMEKLRRIADARLPMNAQIVLCKGVNDGRALDKTIGDLLTLAPQLESLSVVPVGLTKFREGLFDLESFDREDACAVLDQIEGWQDKAMKLCQRHFVFASDEWYLLARRRLPAEEAYDGYLQLENGVGMLRLLEREFVEALAEHKMPLLRIKRKVSIATGRLSAPFVKRLCEIAMERFPWLRVKVFPIKNDFFGEKITVSGLITGRDLIAQLSDKALGDVLLLPVNMFRSGEKVFLDDVSVSDVKEALHIKVHIVKSSGEDLLDSLLGIRQGRRLI